MSSDSPPSSGLEPDRLFTHACMVMFGVGLALLIASHAALGAFLGRQIVELQLISDARTEVVEIRAMMDRIERLAEMEPGAAQVNVRSDLAHSLSAMAQRLATRETTADALSRAAPSVSAAVTPGLLAAVEDTRAATQRDPFTASDGVLLKAAYGGRVLPYASLIANRSESAWERIRQRTTSALLVSALALAAGAAILIAGVVMPVHRRIRHWVARSRETDQDNRFRLLHDPLTRMPNSAYLHAHLDRRVALGARANTHTAVIRIDLDKFDILHQTLGPRTSDEIIRIASRRIQKGLRAGDFAAYLGHDDFVVVAGDLEDENAAAVIAQRIQAALANPFSVRGGPQKLGASLGVTLISDDDADAERLLFNAERALGEAQASGGGIAYFREGLRKEVERRETLYTELMRGLENGELSPYFQPQIDLCTGRLSGFEALVRWEHPRNGVLSPAEFLDFADETDLTERIGQVVLNRALGAMNAWDAAGFHVPRVGVNFALAQLRDPRLIERIKWEVERFDVEPGRVAIEVLETILIKSDADMVVRNLRGLASAGFHIELDDFGTGHASISNLRRFMVNRIKIDRSFISDIETSKEQQQLTASMIAMAKALGIATLAEGVETEAGKQTVRALGCDHFQGYLIARPMSAADTFSWLRDFAGGDLPDHPRSAESDPNTP